MQFKVLLRILFLVVLGLSSHAQFTPISVQGFLDSASADTSGFNTGGKISVNGYDITVPKNMIVQFPATWVPWKDVAGSQFVGSEVAVVGNINNGNPIAAMIQIGQPLAAAGNGIIGSIDYADGSIQLIGGPKLRINDPHNAYSKGYTLDPAFTADDENPSITAFSGFPMCLPRWDPVNQDDPDCPKANRPTSGARVFRPSDVLRMVPFQVGDELGFSGVRRGGEYIAYAIVATNVQATTDHTKGDPTYIRMEDAIIGVVDGKPNAEFADTRFIGYVTDPGVSVTINAIDVDPCTGKEVNRQIGSASPRAGDVRNKFTFRVAGTIPKEYTREYRIIASTDPKPIINSAKTGIIAGEYVQPVTEWIFPELTVPGNPLPVNDFSHMGFLTQGWWDGTTKYGPLDPFPGPKPPAPVVCPGPAPAPADPPAGTAPVAVAGPNVVNRPGTLVTLSAKNTASGLSDSQLTYTWTQISPQSPAITLMNGDTPNPTFIALKLSSKTDFLFQVVVALKTDSTKFSKATMKVTVDPAKAEVFTLLAYTVDNAQGGTISVDVQTDVVDAKQTTMKITLNGNQVGSGTFTMSAVASTPGIYRYSARSTKRPTSLTIFDSLNTNPKNILQVTQTTVRRKRSFNSAMGKAL